MAQNAHHEPAKHHEKGDETTAAKHSKEAHGHSEKAHESSTKAHGKSSAKK